MDPELAKGFQELQAQVIESRSKIANIETRQKITAHDAKVNNDILEEFNSAEDIEKKFFYQPVGRMLVKQEGKKAHEFLIERQKSYQDRLKQFCEVKEVCVNRVKESENSLRELVNKKLNKTVEHQQQQQQQQQTSSNDKDNAPSPSSSDNANSPATTKPATSVEEKVDESK